MRYLKTSKPSRQLKAAGDVLEEKQRWECAYVRIRTHAPTITVVKAKEQLDL